MKVLSENTVKQILSSLTKQSVLKEYQPTLLNSLKTLENPAILPPRIVQTSNTKASDSTHLIMPCIGDKEVGIKMLTGGPGNSKKGLGFVGSVMVFDEITGSLEGVINARTLTAFRTALASTIPMVKVIDPQTPNLAPQITVLGSGLQAYWHARLCLLLYPQMEHVTLINRTEPNAVALEKELGIDFPNVKFSIKLLSDAKAVQSALLESTFIFGCMPSTEAYIKLEHINKDPKRPVYINLIGSYKPHMIELDKEFINSEFKNTKIIVDSIPDSLVEAGELIQTNKTEADLVEIASIDDNISSVVSPNNVTLAKLVGVAIMDISMGKAILSKAGDLGVEVEF